MRKLLFILPLLLVGCTPAFKYISTPCVKVSTRHENYENNKKINDTYGVNYMYEGSGFSNLEEEYAERSGYFSKDFIENIDEIGTCYTFTGNYEGKVFSK